jgi:hypothetical protein
MRGFKALVLLVFVMTIVAGSAAVAQRGKVTIIAPEDGAIIRGVTEVVADKPNPNEGTYAWKVAQAGKEAEAEFQANTIAGLPFLWDTRVRDEEGNRVYPDGEYTITGNGFDADGNLQGSATVRIRIENEIPAAEVADGVELRILLKSGDGVQYEVTGDETAGVEYPVQQMMMMMGGQQPQQQTRTQEYKAALQAAYNLKMLSGGGDGSGGVARQTCTQGVLMPTGLRPSYIDDFGKSFTQQYDGDGAIRPHKSKDEHFELGEIYIRLPSRALRPGARPWKSDMSVVLDVWSLHPQVVTAEHNLEGFEWVMGKKCARIRSEFEEEGVEFDTKIQGTAVKVKGTIGGTRITYFAYEAGFPVTIEESLHHDLEIELKQQMMGGMMGGMAEGGMAPGMMQPGMMEPGMMGMGEPGMMMPGMMEPGMMGMGEPGMMMPGMMQPGMMEGGMMPGMMQPGMMQPGMMEGSMMPGMMQPGMMGGSMMPGMMQPGMMGGSMMPGMMGEGGTMGGMAQPAQKLPTKVDVEFTITQKA